MFPLFPSPQHSFVSHDMHVPNLSLYPDLHLEQFFMSDVHELQCSPILPIPVFPDPQHSSDEQTTHNPSVLSLYPD